MFLLRHSQTGTLLLSLSLGLAACGGSKNKASETPEPPPPPSTTSPGQKPDSTKIPPSNINPDPNDPYVREISSAACSTLGSEWGSAYSNGKYLCVKKPKLKRLDGDQSLNLAPDGETQQIKIGEENVRAFTLANNSSMYCGGAKVTITDNIVSIQPAQLSSFNRSTQWPVECKILVKGTSFGVQSDALEIPVKITASEEQQCSLKGEVFVENECRPIPSITSYLANPEELIGQQVRVGDILPEFDLDIMDANEWAGVEVVIEDETCPGVLVAWLRESGTYKYLMATAKVDRNFDLSSAPNKVCEGKIKYKKNGVLSKDFALMKVTVVPGDGFYGQCNDQTLSAEKKEGLRLLQGAMNSTNQSCIQITSSLRKKKDLKIKADELHAKGGIAADFSFLAYEDQLTSLKFEGVQIADNTDIKRLENLSKLELVGSSVESLDWLNTSRLQNFIFCGGSANEKVLVGIGLATNLVNISLGVTQGMFTWKEQVCTGTPDFLLEKINFNMLPKLQVIEIAHQKAHSRLTLEGLPELKKISVKTTGFDSISLHDLPNLEVLNTTTSPVAKVQLSKLPALKSLEMTVAGKDAVDDLTFRELANLEDLFLNMPAKQAFDLNKLGTLPSLKTLTIKGGVNGNWQNDLDKLYPNSPKLLKSLTLTVTNSASSFSGWNELESINLTFPENASLNQFVDLPTSLKSLTITGGKGLSLDILKNLQLDSLSLNKVQVTTGIDNGIPTLNALIAASLSNKTVSELSVKDIKTAAPDDIDYFTEERSLKRLSIANTSNVDLRWLSHIKELKEFDLSNVPDITSLLVEIGKVSSLDSLSLTASDTMLETQKTVIDISPLRNLQGLKAFVVDGYALTSLEPLTYLPLLDYIFVNLDALEKSEEACPSGRGSEELRKYCYAFLY